MKNLWISIKITLAMCILLGIGYVLVLRLVAYITPSRGEVETAILNGKIVGATNVGQTFTDARYFWGRPSVHQYNGMTSGGSNKGTGNRDYLQTVEQRIDTWLAAHPYLSRKDVPAEMVTASASGLDPDISPAGAGIQVRRIAQARGLSTETVQHIVDSLTVNPLFGASKVNVLQLNIALEKIQPALQ